MSNSSFITTDVLRAKDQHVARRVDTGFSGIHLNVLTSGTVHVEDSGDHLWVIVRGEQETTQVLLPITREQLCGIVCGLWIEDMAEAEQ